MNRSTRVRRPTARTRLPDLLCDLLSQRQRIVALAKQTVVLQARGRHLLATSSTLAESLAQSSAGLVQTYSATRAAAAGLQIGPAASSGGYCAPRQDFRERATHDSPELLEALAQATELLRMEFHDTDGGGSDTLAKCEQALLKARTSCTIELRLY